MTTTDAIAPDVRARRAALLRQFGAMPYGGMVGGRRAIGDATTDTELVEAATDYLGRLAATLRRVADHDNAREAELRRLRQWVTAMGDIAAEAARLADEGSDPMADPSTPADVSPLADYPDLDLDPELDAALNRGPGDPANTEVDQ